MNLITVGSTPSYIEAIIIRKVESKESFTPVQKAELI